MGSTSCDVQSDIILTLPNQRHILFPPSLLLSSLLSAACFLRGFSTFPKKNNNNNKLLTLSVTDSSHPPLTLLLFCPLGRMTATPLSRRSSGRCLCLTVLFFFFPVACLVCVRPFVWRVWPLIKHAKSTLCWPLLFFSHFCSVFVVKPSTEWTLWSDFRNPF